MLTGSVGRRFLDAGCHVCPVPDEWVVVLLAMTIAGSLCLSEEIAALAPDSIGAPASDIRREDRAALWPGRRRFGLIFWMPVWCYLLARESEGSACGIFTDCDGVGLSCATHVFQVAMDIRTV